MRPSPPGSGVPPPPGAPARGRDTRSSRSRSRSFWEAVDARRRVRGAPWRPLPTTRFPPATLARKSGRAPPITARARSSSPAPSPSALCLLLSQTLEPLLPGRSASLGAGAALGPRGPHRPGARARSSGGPARGGVRRPRAPHTLSGTPSLCVGVTTSVEVSLVWRPDTLAREFSRREAPPPSPAEGSPACHCGTATRAA